MIRRFVLAVLLCTAGAPTWAQNYLGAVYGADLALRRIIVPTDDEELAHQVLRNEVMIIMPRPPASEDRWAVPTYVMQQLPRLEIWPPGQPIAK